MCSRLRSLGSEHEHKNQSQRMTAGLSEKTESATYVKRRKVESSVPKRFLSFPYRWHRNNLSRSPWYIIFFQKEKKEEKKKERNGKKKRKRGENKRKGEKKEKSIRSGLIGGERKGEWDEIGEIEVTISRERERERQRSKLKPRFNVSGRESAYHTRRSQSTN